MDRRTERRRAKKQWDADHWAIADKWFGSDLRAAEAVLDALPYSDIPGWYDVDRVMQAIAGRGVE